MAEGEGQMPLMQKWLPTEQVPTGVFAVFFGVPMEELLGNVLGFMYVYVMLHKHLGYTQWFQTLVILLIFM